MIGLFPASWMTDWVLKDPFSLDLGVTKFRGNLALKSDHVLKYLICARGYILHFYNAMHTLTKNMIVEFHILTYLQALVDVNQGAFIA